MRVRYGNELGYLSNTKREEEEIKCLCGRDLDLIHSHLNLNLKVLPPSHEMNDWTVPEIFNYLETCLILIIHKIASQKEHFEHIVPILFQEFGETHGLAEWMHDQQLWGGIWISGAFLKNVPCLKKNVNELFKWYRLTLSLEVGEDGTGKHYGEDLATEQDFVDWITP